MKNARQFLSQSVVLTAGVLATSWDATSISNSTEHRLSRQPARPPGRGILSLSRLHISQQSM